MAEQETIADIIAEMQETKYGDAECEVKWCLTQWADRLEAAHKRERGDSAKLREAVGYILKYADSVACRDHDEHTRHYIDQIRKWAQSALAAPPRNCERFGSSTQARAEWYKTEVLPRVEGVVSGVEPPFVDWLFAPATEKEGGNDGNK